ncbi:hypothetical protein ABZ912_50370 [Nonomuraea angiospora]|uniref:hypothetical protein n=1 Tax=Nonomuraea angiospora TaxID=46172 RepID=UPI0033C550A3
MYFYDETWFRPEVAQTPVPVIGRELGVVLCNGNPVRRWTRRTPTRVAAHADGQDAVPA